MSAERAPTGAPLVLDGNGLCCEKVPDVAREGRLVAVGPAGLRMRGVVPAAGPLGDASDLAAAALDTRTADRPLDADIDAAEALLPALAVLLPRRLTGPSYRALLPGPLSGPRGDVSGRRRRPGPPTTARIRAAGRAPARARRPPWPG
jgi:hypothetical protein